MSTRRWPAPVSLTAWRRCAPLPDERTADRTVHVQESEAERKEWARRNAQTALESSQRAGTGSSESLC